MATIEELRQGIADAKELARPDIEERLTKELARMQAEKPAGDGGLMDQWSEEIKDDPSLGTAAYQGIFNIPGSAWQAAKDMVQPVLHPIDTAQGLNALAKGATEHANLALSENLPDWAQAENLPEWLRQGIGTQKASRDKPTPEMELAKKAGGILGHRAVHWRETLRDDPVGLLSDVAGILMPVGGAIRGVGTLSRVERLANAGRHISRAGEVLQPSNIVTRPIPGIVRNLPIVGEEASLARMRRRAPSQQQVQADTTAAYQDINRQGLRIDPQANRQMVGDINAEVARPNMYPETRTEQSRGVIDRINRTHAESQAPFRAEVQAAQTRLAQAQERARASAATRSPSATADAQNVRFMEAELAQAEARAARGPALSVEDAENARRMALDVRGTNTDRGLAGRVLGSIDRAFGTLRELPAVRNARELGRRNWLADALDEMEHAPETRAGYESSVRGMAQSFLKKHGDSLTQTERDAFNKIVRREGAMGIIHTLASRIGLMAGAAGGLLGTHNPIFGGTAAVGANVAARSVAEAYTRSMMQRAMQTVLAGRESQRTHQRRTDWRRTGYQTLGRGGAAAGTYLRPYGAMTRPEPTE